MEQQEPQSCAHFLGHIHQEEPAHLHVDQLPAMFIELPLVVVIQAPLLQLTHHHLYLLPIDHGQPLLDLAAKSCSAGDASLHMCVAQHIRHSPPSELSIPQQLQRCSHSLCQRVEEPAVPRRSSRLFLLLLVVTGPLVVHASSLSSTAPLFPWVVALLVLAALHPIK